jgi:SPP1 family predicted phage head-tail adaptor
MQAGDLRDRVGFYQRAATSDGYGNSEGEFPDAPEFTVAANIKPRLGGESVLASRLQGTHLANITVRVSAQTRQVTEAWRVKNERTGEVYNIRSIIDPEQATHRQGRVLEMLCEKGVAT